MHDFIKEYLGKEANERIQEKFGLIDNDLFFEFAIQNDIYKVNDKEKELQFYKEHIEKQEQYLLNCGYKKEYLDKFKKESLERTKKHFNMVRISKEILGIRS